MLKILCAPRLGENGSTAAYSLLEQLYLTEYGGDLPDIKKTPNGKPYFPGRVGIFFSISHARTHVLCALSDKPVGADIESPRHLSERVVRFFCSPEELSLFDPLDLWVLKESYIKLIGGTLPLVKKLRFSRRSDEPSDTDQKAGAHDFREKTMPPDLYMQNNSSKIFIPSDSLCSSRLYRIGDCRAAVSTYGGELPDTIDVL